MPGTENIPSTILYTLVVLGKRSIEETVQLWQADEKSTGQLADRIRLQGTPS